MKPEPAGATSPSTLPSAHRGRAIPALLPPGFRDLLPPEAEAEADGLAAIMAVFASHGYERVRPPLLEFEDSLLSGSGAAVAEQTFRLMDPDTHRMMGLRPDMTPQVARIAATRLADAPRPMRLSYAGACVQLGGGGQLDTERQVSQAGIELIGPDNPAADAELVAIGAEALDRLGVPNISFDLTMPSLVAEILEHGGIVPADHDVLRHALDRKDAATVARCGGDSAELLTELLHAAGPAGRALDVLGGARLPPAARRHGDRLAETAAAIAAAVPGLRLTVDPVEFRGWRYHTGVCFTVYASHAAEELGRGGRYVAAGEAACGLTFRTEALLRAAPRMSRRPRLFVPHGSDRHHASALRAEGYDTVAGLDPHSEPETEARRLGCTHLLRDHAAIPLGA